MITIVRALRRHAVAAGVLFACAVAAGSPAVAQNISVSVTAVPSPVTLSRTGADSFASYRFAIFNNTGGNLNRVRFRGTTTVAGDVAPFINPNVSDVGVVLDPNPVVVSSGSINCTITGNAIDCIIGNGGELPRGAAAAFYAVVRAPMAGSSIIFNWNVRHGSGASEGTIVGAPTITLLEEGNGDSVSLYVPRAGATLFTGINAVTTTSDPLTTKLTVSPQDATAITASIAEDDNGGNSCSPNVQCLGTTLSVLKHQTLTKAAVGDGLTSPLVIVLRRDAKTFKKGFKLSNLVIYYQAVPVMGGGGIEVRSCLVNGIYTPPTADTPCVLERRQYTKQTAPTPDLIGDVEIVIEANDNGRFIM